MKTIRLDSRRLDSHRTDSRLHRGKAYLIGAGPGRADLITVRGLRLLQQADVVIYDRLVAQELLTETKPGAELIFVGKGPGRHTLAQEEINDLIVARVRQGKQVARLKGGDPFVFGRGGEEALALHEAGLPFEIVPGVSSAISAPAYAGIPVTQRGVATSFAVVTGHECEDSGPGATDWAALSRIPTLVILMGVGHIAQIADALIAAGRAPQTPAAAISWAATDRQRTVRAELSTIAARIRDEGISAPAVIVVGEVAALHDQLAWFHPDGEAAGFLPLDPPQPMLAAAGD